MKAPTASSSAPRAQQYTKRRSPGVAGQRGPSPGSTRTSPASVEMQRHAQLSPAERQLLPLLEREYRDDVRAYMYEMQSKTAANAELIDQQPELKWYMRGFLVDFLVEIHLQHRLRPETLYLALNIVDRYVSKRIVFKKHYQLVGCAALWIAAKFEDAKDRVPTLPELVEMCSNAYDEKAFVQMEGHVLSTINWVIGHPTAEAWLRMACVGLEDVRTQHVARFLMELTLFHREFIQFNTSDIAMASLLLGRYMLGKNRRPHEETDAVSRIMLMLDELLGEHLEEVSPVVLKKYSFPFYSRASTFAREWYLTGRRFQYHDFSSASSSPAPSTPCRPLPRSASSSVASCGSSNPAIFSSPNQLSDDSDTSLSSDDDDDFDDQFSSCGSEPLTPLTPVPPPTDPFVSLALAAETVAADAASRVVVGKENPPAPMKGVVVGHPQHPHLPAVRPPLERASWEMNHQPQRMYASAPSSSSAYGSSPSAYRP
ncbi:hypothetical protein JCM8097_007267 [Rhodosporidiobolus ruineniae]